MRVALLKPEIAGNVGAVLRLGACVGAAVGMIEPMGFAWHDRQVRRAAMDYIDHVEVARHASLGAFREAMGRRRLVLLTTKASPSAYDFAFRADDVLLLGKESAGVLPGVAAPSPRGCGCRCGRGTVDERRHDGGTGRGAAPDGRPAGMI